MKNILLFIVLFVGIFCVARKLPPIPDYSQDASWLHLEKEPKKKFDVFFVHPTTYINEKDGMNASIDNEEANKGAKRSLKLQASAFKATCNIYAPHYRQATIKILSLPKKDRAKYLNVGVNDMHDAFEYYLKHYNNGRAYILAGHSQGSQVILDFLLKYKSLIDKKKLIAVYAVGYTITAKDIKHIGIPLAVKADQLGGIITWNTVGKDGKSPVLNPGALCVNPLSWTDSPIEQAKSKNIYAYILDKKNNKMLKIPHFTSAKIDKRGALVIPTPTILNQLSMGMGREVYHEYDYSFFYANIVENVAKRCKAWQKKNSNIFSRLFCF